jgi:menaquinol-cytochrome c reductase cytochrome b/c subunit
MTASTPSTRTALTPDAQKTQKLLDLVKGDRYARSEAPERDEVLVWPHLVVIEAVAAAVFLIVLTVVSILVRSPLESLANPAQTPNPSKAPWYFLNLQELLLHMNVALAGVVLPGLALTLVAAIPYFDRDPTGVGRYFPTTKGKQICIYSVIYTTAVEVGLVFWDNTYWGPTQTLARTHFENLPLIDDNKATILRSWIIPGLIILFFIAVLVITTLVAWKPTTRELMIALFTAFAVSYWVLAIIGTGFRGESQHLVWPWDLPDILKPNPPPVG